MKFKNFIPSIKTALGINSFAVENGRTVLLAEQKEKLRSYKFPDSFIEDFEKSLNDDTEAAGDAAESVRVAAIAAVLGETVSQLNARTEELEAMKVARTADAATMAAVQAQVQELTSRVKILSELPETDPGAAAGRRGTEAAVFNIDDDAQLGGMAGEMFALSRPYNQRARQALAQRQGRLLAAADYSSMDYSTLREDLGAFYRIPWRDRLQSMLVALPTVEALFPLESGYQDLATLVNVWLGEFSQADNTIGSDFDKVTKGSYSFGQETLRMYGVMFSHKFKNLKEIERLWIGSLNKEGSDPIKWSFIEYLLAQTAIKLHNERELRRINGVRKNPNPNVPGTAMSAADGYFEYLRKRQQGFVDFTVDSDTTGKTVYQLKPFDLEFITPENIGDVIYRGTSMVPAQYRDAGNVVLYMPSWLLPWYHKFNELKYGANQDYKAGEMFVHEYPSVKIKTVPNADNHYRLVWTIDGNFKTYEDRPGEMLDFKIEQQDWTLKIWSNWKEGFAAEAVGRKVTDPAALDINNQFIWMTPYDFAPSYFVPVDPDTNPRVTNHKSVVTATNSEPLNITDIEGVAPGDIVSIKCGDASEAHGVTIRKEGKFALISQAWTPALGDVITLMCTDYGKFIELGRTSGAEQAYRFPADANTPSVASGTEFVIGENTKATAITTLEGAETGKVYTIHGAGTTYASTIANAGNFVLTAAATLSDGTYIKLALAADGKFYEVARS